MENDNPNKSDIIEINNTNKRKNVNYFNDENKKDGINYTDNVENNYSKKMERDKKIYIDEHGKKLFIELADKFIPKNTTIPHLENSEKIGLKYDDNKLRHDLIPIDCLNELIKVYMYGCIKYDDWNWVNVEPPIQRWWNAAKRHLDAIGIGEVINEDDGNLYHAAQVAWNAFAILYHQLRGERWKANNPK